MQTDLIPVWSGATWRDYPQPTVADPRRASDKPTSTNGRIAFAAKNRARVRASCTDNWQTVQQIAVLAQMTPQGVQRHLRDAVRDGLVECRVCTTTRSWGRAARQFRRLAD